MRESQLAYQPDEPLDHISTDINAVQCLRVHLRPHRQCLPSGWNYSSVFRDRFRFSGANQEVFQLLRLLMGHPLGRSLARLCVSFKCCFLVCVFTQLRSFFKKFSFITSLSWLCFLEKKFVTAFFSFTRHEFWPSPTIPFSDFSPEAHLLKAFVNFYKAKGLSYCRLSL